MVEGVTICQPARLAASDTRNIRAETTKLAFPRRWIPQRRENSIAVRATALILLGEVVRATSPS